MAQTTHQLFQALDNCHQRIQESLVSLKRMAKHMEVQGLDKADRQLAGAIEAFFSSTSRQHHADEETHVFSALLANGSEELKSAVRGLQQEHGFIEENWIELGPQLRGIAEGNDWFTSEEFQHNVATFVNLLEQHIAREESMIYPESKAHWDALLTPRQSQAVHGLG
jgi:hemerythrin-like domain-containing protein